MTSDGAVAATVSPRKSKKVSVHKIITMEGITTSAMTDMTTKAAALVAVVVDVAVPRAALLTLPLQKSLLLVILRIFTQMPLQASHYLSYCAVTPTHALLCRSPKWLG